VKPTEWSDWVRAEFRPEGRDPAEGSIRFKLLELAPDGGRFRLYRSDAFPADGGFVSDPALGKRLVEELGPYVHSGMSVSLHCRGEIDWRTADEIMADEAAWWSRAAELAADSGGASLLFLHWHILDCVGHALVGKLDPTGGGYDAEGVEANTETLRDYYRAADRFVGEFLKRFDDGETVFCVISDHGMPANVKAVSLVNAFRERGWLELTPDGTGVDWKRSKVFFAQNHLWINLAGRDEGGVVPPGEYGTLRAEVIAAMRDIKDPESGEHAFAFVLSREDAPLVGLAGPYVGDVAYCYSGGFRWSGPEVLRLGEARVVFPCAGGNHGPMVPTYETETTSVLAAMALAGPGVSSRGVVPKEEPLRLWTTDVAPTACHLLGIDPPAQSEGRVMHELLEDIESGFPERALRTVERRIVPRPRTRPAPVRLQGDVTDEE
jgi:hypothetical protein